MLLKITSPNREILEEGVEKLVAEASTGSFCILPHHIDFVTDIEAGIVGITNKGEQEFFFAVADGLLVKRGKEVFLCVKEASEKAKLGEIEAKMQEVLGTENDEAKRTQSDLVKLELNFIKQFYDLTKQSG